MLSKTKAKLYNIARRYRGDDEIDIDLLEEFEGIEEDRRYDEKKDKEH